MWAEKAALIVSAAEKFPRCLQANTGGAGNAVEGFFGSEYSYHRTGQTLAVGDVSSRPKEEVGEILAIEGSL
jgi:hypothetical protein